VRDVEHTTDAEEKEAGEGLAADGFLIFQPLADGHGKPFRAY
jgi:hypothetical protein